MPKDGIFRLASMSIARRACSRSINEPERLGARGEPDWIEQRDVLLRRRRHRHDAEDNAQFEMMLVNGGLGLGVQVVEDPIAADLRVSTDAVAQAIIT